MTDKVMPNQAFNSVANLEKKIKDWIDKHNTNPTPFTWIKDAQTNLTKINHAHTTLEPTTNQKTKQRTLH
ncbi:hypothetical protein K5713_08345 [Trueperella pyogenes]|uniref:hypothetical protein n=1 Tax=Trueperella pyogenes TaxID=1661 RepID=UPI00216786F8|nr:hypothetical protein [Trueperella pyogenes]UVJ53409.1 hypothetical protein K5713_08345 [Trueperella pyogenes]